MFSNICVFCGSSPGNKKEYKEEAIKLGRTLIMDSQGLYSNYANIAFPDGSVNHAGGDTNGLIIAYAKNNALTSIVGDDYDGKTAAAYK